MSILESPEPHRQRRQELALTIFIMIVGVLCLISLLYVEIESVQKKTELLPVSLNSKQNADYGIDPTSIRIPGVRLDLVQDVIHDQEPDADAKARFATVQANLLTPVAWLISPTPTVPTEVPQPTGLPTLTPTPTDPWIALGEWRVGCKTEISFNPVSALKFKFQMISGGGDDSRVSFYCCGSSGASFLVNGVWQPVTDQSVALRVGDWRETGDLNGAVVSRAQFSVGCNDKEEAQARIYYLPAGASDIAMTRTLTATIAPTPTSAPSSILPPTATSTPTP